MSAASIATSVPVPMAEPDVGLGQRGGVVDAVADHADPRPSPCRRWISPALCSGSTSASDAVDADLRGRWRRRCARCRR